ncbi:MAG: BA14K family protein [Hyphomicrobiaceae bacterium]
MTPRLTARSSLFLTLTAVAASAALVSTQPAAAAAAGALPGLSTLAAGAPATERTVVPSTGTVHLAQYRGRHHWRRGWHHGRRWGHGRWGHRHRRYGYGPSVAGAIASAIIGGTIAASQRDHRDAWQRCDDRYRSFRWSDGTFQPYGDEPRRLCPYLER